MLILNQTAPFLRTFTRFFFSRCPSFSVSSVKYICCRCMGTFDYFLPGLDFCLENESESKNFQDVL